jgi:hypothetical protein
MEGFQGRFNAPKGALHDIDRLFRPGRMRSEHSLCHISPCHAMDRCGTTEAQLLQPNVLLAPVHGVGSRKRDTKFERATGASALPYSFSGVLECC